MTVRLFAGFDPREAVGFHAFVESLIATSPGVGVTPLSGPSDGTNAFTLARFRIFEAVNWGSWAIFVDGADMLLKADINELWSLRDPKYAIQVVKHEYVPKEKRKYIGTSMEADNSPYPRKNWSSVMIINGGHRSHFNNRHAIGQALEENAGAFLHRFSWLDDEEIGDLPVEWNWLDEYGENNEAKLLHWTNGIPGFYHYHNAPHASEWRNAVRRVIKGMDP